MCIYLERTKITITNNKRKQRKKELDPDIKEITESWANSKLRNAV